MSTHKIDISDVTKFNGSYFNIWKHRLTLIFKVEKLWPLVSGIQPLPMAPTAAELAAGALALPLTGVGSINMWEDQDAIALTIITNCLEISIVSHIQSCTTSHLAWSGLISIFESQDIVTKMHLKDRLINLKMQDNANIIKHIHNFRAHLEQLQAAGSPLLDDEAVIMLMRSLPQNYQPFIRSLQRQELGLTLQTLITDLIQKETFIKDTSPTSEKNQHSMLERRISTKARNLTLTRTLKQVQIQKERAVAPNLLRRRFLQQRKSVFTAKSPDITLKTVESKLLQKKVLIQDKPVLQQPTTNFMW